MARVSLAGHHWMMHSFSSPDVPDVKVTAGGVDVSDDDLAKLQEAATRHGITLVVEADPEPEDADEPEAPAKALGQAPMTSSSGSLIPASPGITTTNDDKAGA